MATRYGKLFRPMVALALGAALTGCSSNAKAPTTTTRPAATTTTLQPAQRIAAVKSLFAGTDGKQLLRFLSETRVIATGTMPPQATCAALQTRLTSEGLTNDALQATVGKVVDPQLKVNLGQNVFGIAGLLGFCTLQRGAAPTVLATNVRANHRRAGKLLAGYGIAIP